MTMHGEGKGLKKPEKILSFHLRPILGTEKSINIKQERNKKTANPGEMRRSDFQSFHIIRFKHQSFQQKLL